MSAVYRLRIERDPDAEDYPSAEDLGRIFSEAQALISDYLPEGWYCKIDQLPASASLLEAWAVNDAAESADE